LVICSGLLLSASFPEFGHGIFAWIALVPLMISLRNLSLYDGFRIGFLAGLVHYVTLLYWFVPFLKTYGPFPMYLSIAVLLVLSAYMALYIALFSMMFVWLNASAISCFFFSPMIWVSLEYIRSFLFTGFPWELLGYSQFNALHIIQISDILGVVGISFIIVLFNTTLFFWFLFFSKRRWQGQNVSRHHIQLITAVFVILFAMVWGYGTRQIHSMEKAIARSPEKRIAVVQGNIDQTLKWDSTHQRSTVNKYLDLSLTQRAEQPDLIVWPETAMPFYLFHHLPLTDMVTRGIQEAETDFIVSSPSFTQSENRIRYFNRAFLILSNGTVIDTYDKAHLVPFGEYVPLKKWLPFLGKMVEQVGDFSSGKAGDTLKWQEHRIGMLICYEVIFPYLSRAAVQHGAGVLINVTNDAWYGYSSAPYQHFSMAVFRAIENRRSLVRSANTGISGFIDPVGRVLVQTPIFKEASLTMGVPLLSVLTLYTRWGDVFAWGCLAVLILMIVRRCLKQKHELI
jgi:apolipoprotein N-acyltransferase